MAGNRRGGILFLTINGKSYDCKGTFTITPGGDDRDAVQGANSIPGFKAQPRVPTIEGVIVDKGDLDLEELYSMTDGTASLGIGSGRTGVLRNAWFAGTGKLTTEEGEIELKLQGKSLDLIPAL